MVCYSRERSRGISAALYFRLSRNGQLFAACRQIFRAVRGHEGPLLDFGPGHFFRFFARDVAAFPQIHPFRPCGYFHPLSLGIQTSPGFTGNFRFLFDDYSHFHVLRAKIYFARFLEGGPFFESWSLCRSFCARSFPRHGSQSGYSAPDLHLDERRLIFVARRQSHSSHSFETQKSSRNL